MREIKRAYESSKFRITPALLAALLTLHYFDTVRYINSRSSNHLFRSPIYRDEVLSGHSERDFRSALRVMSKQFDFVLKIIRDHQVFRYQGKRRQADVAIQLKVALHRLGHDGPLSCFEAIGRTLGTSVGSAKKYTERCIDALCDNITKFVKWPNAEDKDKIKQHFKTKAAAFPIYLAPSTAL
ncbi:hypothetical protein BC939DRAFT_500424 [Gamsiella multidivaricata]|uniref:uncharacterized protein n=1 Tax=Gamsiella multidivaricata TaxID=101098 RepID=UPI00221F6082|nr:uncharacterized protein BC939DRAFT_500424 [Gamsiella multidivaricata]KAI7828976.1 hypothetical protein BC939DRAFT_500424 [Gamsiella multidivaricata]